MQIDVITEKWAKISKNISVIISLFIAVLYGFGFFIISSYCLGIYYYPEFSLSETIPLFYAAVLAFVFFHSIFLALGWLFGIWIYYLSGRSTRRRDTDSTSTPVPGTSPAPENPYSSGLAIISGVVFAFCFLSLIASALLIKPMALYNVISFIFSYTASGYLICSLHNTFRIPKNQAKAIIILSFAIFLPLVTPNNGNMVIHSAMKMIGVRTESVDIRIGKDDLEKVQDVIEKEFFAVSDCSTKYFNSNILKGANILWRGINDRSYIEINSRQHKDSSGIRFVAKSIDIVTVKANRKPCYRIQSDLLFPTKRADFQPTSDEILETVANDIRERGVLVSAEITGYSDPRTSINPDNVTLSKMRADTLKDWMIKNFDIAPEMIKTSGMGDRNPLVDCSGEPNPDACNAPNRRVEFILSVKEKEHVEVDLLTGWLREKFLSIMAN